MIISVRVVPRSSRNKVCDEGQRLKVHLSRPAQDGEANAQLVEQLARHFKVKKYELRIIKGLRSRDKLVELSTPGTS